MPEQKHPSRVMLVEDDEIAAASLLKTLTKGGFQVLSFGSAAEALAASQGWRPDIVMADLHLPGMDGLSLLMHFRDTGSTCRLFLIAGSIDSSPLLEARRASLRGVTILSRPIAPDRLLDLLRRDVSGSTLHSYAHLLSFEQVTPAAMAFALEFFYRSARGQLTTDRGVKGSGGECATLFGEICYNSLAFRYEAPNVSSHLELYMAFRALWIFHQGDPLQQAICARVLVFHLLMERASGDLLTDWTSSVPGDATSVYLDAEVITAMSQVQLNKRWLTSDNGLLRQVFRGAEARTQANRRLI